MLVAQSRSSSIVCSFCELAPGVLSQAMLLARSRWTCVVMCDARQSFSGFVVVVVVVVDVFCLALRQQIGGGARFSRVSLRESCLGVEASLVIPPHHKNIHIDMTRSFPENSCFEPGRRAAMEQTLLLARNSSCRTDNQDKGNSMKQRTFWLKCA